MTADEAAVAVIDGLDRAGIPFMIVGSLGRDAFMATAEDMIITKLRWASAANRTKDRDDVRNIIAVRGAELDWDYIERWCTTHGTLPLLVEIRGSLPPG